MTSAQLSAARDLPSTPAGTKDISRRPVRVCIVSANLPPLYTGGGQQAVTLGVALASLGHEVVFVTKRHGNLPVHDRLQGLDVLRVEYETERRLGITRSARQLFSLAQHFVALRRRFDVVLFFNAEGGLHNSWVILPLLHRLGKPTATRMTLVESNDPAALQRKRYSWLRMMPYRLHHRVVGISSALCSSFQTVFGSDPRLVYIPNGVDLARFRPLPVDQRAALRQKLGLHPSFRYCTFVGRVSHRKGIDILINAWRDVIARHPDARMLLVGPTFDEFRGITKDGFAERLAGTIEQYGLASTITWVGRTDEPEQYLQASDIFVFPSRREGCPNALLEAMACELPIVTTRIPKITEDLITPDVHGVVTPSDAAAFADGIIRLLSDPGAATRLGRAAYERALEEFGIDTIARRYAEMLQSLRDSNRT